MEKLNRVQVLEADIDLRTVDICAALMGLPYISPNLLRHSSVEAYHLGEQHAASEFGSSQNLISANGFRLDQQLGIDLPIWYVVEHSGQPSQVEVTDFLANELDKIEKGFAWPEQAVSFDVALGRLRAAYGLGYRVGLKLKLESSV